MKLDESFGGVIVVGDEMNDALTLATATVGVAMGAAENDTAAKSADATLMPEGMSKLSCLMHYLGGYWREGNAHVRVPLSWRGRGDVVETGTSLGVRGNPFRLGGLDPDWFA